MQLREAGSLDLEGHYGYEKGQDSDYLEDTESRGFINQLREKKNQGPLQILWPINYKNGIAIHRDSKNNGRSRFWWGEHKIFVFAMFISIFQMEI